jgi:hypothetical protein
MIEKEIYMASSTALLTTISESKETIFSEVMDTPPVNSECLKDIFRKFSPPKLFPECKLSACGHVPFLISNDIALAGGPDYLKVQMQLCAAPAKDKGRTCSIGITLFSSISRRFAWIVGNGNVLSLLPELPAENILLVDIDPAVHFYIFNVRNLILQAPDEDFQITKNRLQQSIVSLEHMIYKINGVTVLQEALKSATKHNGNYLVYKPSEENDLGECYFLSSRERFMKCKAALQKKHLLPITHDIFDSAFMKSIGNEIRKVKGVITYLNCTNVLEYGREAVGRENFSNLPLAENCLSILTTENNGENTVIFYHNADEFRQSLLTPEQMEESTANANNESLVEKPSRYCW